LTQPFIDIISSEHCSIILVNSSFAVNPSLRKNLPCDTVKDIASIAPNERRGSGRAWRRWPAPHRGRRDDIGERRELRRTTLEDVPEAALMAA
jgi:hypothetical protein